MEEMNWLLRTLPVTMVYVSTGMPWSKFPVSTGDTGVLRVSAMTAAGVGASFSPHEEGSTRAAARIRNKYGIFSILRQRYLQFCQGPLLLWVWHHQSISP